MTDQSEQSAESLPDNPTIDATSLFNAALKADEEGKWGNDGALDADALEIVKGAKEVTPGNRAPDESGEQQETKDKAEPSAEQPQEHTGHPKGPQRDPVTGKFLPKDAKVEAKPAETPEQKPETPYSKAKKEEERQKSLLANFEKEKQQFRAEIEAEKQRLASEKAEIERFKQIPRSKDGSPHKFTATQYTEAADDFYGRAKQAFDNGDIDQGKQLLAQAESLSKSGAEVAQFEQQQAQQQSYKQHESIWNQNAAYAVQQDPSLKDPENPVTKEVMAILDPKTPSGREWAPFLRGIPNGFGVAAQIMKWKVAAVENSALSEKLKSTEAELEKARARIGIRPAPSAGMPSAKTPDNMSPDEFKRWLQHEAAEQDRMPAFG
jgi:hypothetical protein